MDGPQDLGPLELSEPLTTLLTRRASSPELVWGSSVQLRSGLSS